MTLKEVRERIEGEAPKTEYARGVKAYAVEMISAAERRHGAAGENWEVPCVYGVLEEEILRPVLGSFEKWGEGERERKRDMVMKRLGIRRYVGDWEDIGEIQDAALKSAFMLIWGEVQVLKRMEETYMIRVERE